MKKIALISIALLLMFSLSSAMAQYDKRGGSNLTPKQQDIKKLMDMTGSGGLGKQVMEQMTGSYKSIMPNVPDHVWNDLLSEFNPNELVAMLIPVYDKHFTHADIKALIAFYESPIGQKYIKTLPMISAESMLLGQKWGEDFAKRFVKKMAEKGYK